MQVTQPQCRDAFNCEFRGLDLPAGPVRVEVVDVDLANNDIIGEGACVVGPPCAIGAARITFLP